jgi:hypothetical protein
MPRARSVRDAMAARRAGLPVRYAALFAGGAEEIADLASARVRATGDCRDLAVLAARTRSTIERGATLDPAAGVALLQQVDAPRPSASSLLLDAIATRSLPDGRTYRRCAAPLRRGCARSTPAPSLGPSGRCRGGDPCGAHRAVSRMPERLA